FGTFLLLPTIALLTMRWRGQVGRWTYPLLVLLLVGAGGSKGSEVPVLVVGALLASAAAVLGRHPQWRRVLLDTGTALVVLVLLIKLVFGGGTGGTTVAPMRQLLELQGDLLVGRSSDVTGPALLSFLLLAMVPIFGGAVAGLRVVLGRDTRSDPMGWALLGCALAGAGAIVALAHPSLSTYYFLFAADAPLSVLIGWGLALMLRHVGRPVALAVTGAVAGVGGVLVTGAVLGDLEGSTSRQQHAYAALLLFLAVVGVVALVAGVVLAGPEGRRRATIAVAVAALSFAGVTDEVRELRSPLPPARFGPVKQAGAISAVEVRAARWLRDHSQRDDLVMTNRHCRAGTGPHCDHRRFVVAAYAERGLLLEGWAYTRTSNRLGTDEVSGNRVGFWNQDLLRLNDGFLTDPNAADARRLWDLGVRWAFVQRSAPHADTLAPYATEKAHFGPVRIYRLREPGAAR
ncbi:MAG: hypothetical protein HOQ22_02580, partial [Nocardioidaceae bacterium]|nr:hypothetical protein [Nocardioidaceae bacterium]